MGLVPGLSIGVLEALLAAPPPSTGRCLDSRAERVAFERDARSALLGIVCEGQGTRTKHVTVTWSWLPKTRQHR